ncbi:BRO family protein [Rhodosalinus sediminis]|uniref:BRO family protein n=1 Tax=Rhodosalinus sediminis TaxID=1940533 RepID=A0A3D9BZR2_9RHOB|nr:BRO family protein [Rhodosalinus sediminis]REC58984.1 BRO family protein [Rhodosalinus sediminis]
MCDLLGISQPGVVAKRRLDPEDRRHVFQTELSKVTSNHVSFPNRGMLCVNETGIYDLIGASRKPAARAFRKWVNGTVLPAIRKDGGYVRGEENFETEEDIMALSLRAMEMPRKKRQERKKKHQLGSMPRMVTASHRRRADPRTVVPTVVPAAPVDRDSRPLLPSPC